MTDLITCIKYIQDGKKGLPDTNGGEGWRERRAAVEALAEKIKRDLPKVRITVRGDGTRVSIAGVRASSTMGIEGALGNWVTAARRQLDKTGFIRPSAEKENVR